MALELLSAFVLIRIFCKIFTNIIRARFFLDELNTSLPAFLIYVAFTKRLVLAAVMLEISFGSSLFNIFAFLFASFLSRGHHTDKFGLVSDLPFPCILKSYFTLLSRTN